jgi:pimeloyl-ACP methyl ester carboxylesterase
MGTFESFDGIKLHFDDRGSGAPVLLLHGFAADSAANWVQPKVADALVESGRQVVLVDARGHGRSDKPHDPSAYANNAMVDDARAAIEHFGWDEIDVVGYSMGAITTLRLAATEGRVRKAVFGGIGARIVTRGLEGREAIADALLAEDKDAIPDPGARAFREFADSTGADKQALAAVQRGGWEPLPDLGLITAPVLVICGDRDTLVGAPDELARMLPHATSVVVSGDHLSAVGDPRFRQEIVSFLAS